MVDVNAIAVSPNGSLCTSGGKDGVIMLWDLAEGKRLYSLDVGDIIYALYFNPNRYGSMLLLRFGISRARALL